MGLFSQIISFFNHYLFITSWRDILEIFFLSSMVYALIRWLAQDVQKNILFWFYSYAALLFGTYYLNLQIIHMTLFVTSPVALMLFILLHQQTLQKNFITLTSLSTKAHATNHWLEELIQASLYALNKNREVFCIIERTDALDQFLSANSIFNATITRELLELLIEKIDHNGPIVLWVTHAGKLHAINPTWNATVDEIWVTEDVKALHKWKQDALFMTHKSDALMFALSPTTRLCTLITEGKIVPDLSAHHAFALLKNYCSLQSKQGDQHVTSHTQQLSNKQTRSEN
jgi:DNA integrity scanning protein DisA with diadenylate cyclase activity